LQILPAQQACPVPPHATHDAPPFPPAGWRHAKPAAQKSPSPTDGQQRSPSPPQAKHTLLPPQRVYGAVHSTSPAQQGSPKPPQAPQPPFEQVPSVPGHALPDAMQRFVS
jgi:hypothetical protein